MDAPVHYGSVCDDVVDCATGNPNLNNTHGGGGPTDGATDASVADGDASASSVAIVGVLSLSNAIPVSSSPGALMPQDGWQITAVDAPTSVPVTTADGGVFSFASVPLVGGAYRLSAAPPPGSGTVQAFMEASPAAATEHPQFVAISFDALRNVALAGGIAADDTLSQFVVQLFGAASTLAGVSVELRDDMDRPLPGVSPIYDVDGGTFSSALTATGMRGVAVFVNVAGAITGRPLRVRLVRGTGTPVEYAATAYPNHIQWVPLAAP